MTRKQIGAVCGAVVLAVITPLLVLTLLHGFGGTARAQVDPHYACHYTSPAGGAPQTTVNLETQFGWEYDVAVFAGETLCAPAIKTRDGQPPEGTLGASHLRCFEIYDPAPGKVVNLTTQFDYYENVDVGPAVQLCLPVEKWVLDPPGMPEPPPLEAEPHYKCYDLSAAGLPSVGEWVTVETQFFPMGASVLVEEPALLCLPAGKNGAPIPGAPHEVCYNAYMPPPGWIVGLNTQFWYEYGFNEAVDVWDGQTLCVPAVKEIVVPDADVKILSQAIYAEDCMSDPPTDIDVSADVVICVDKVLHHNGPYADPVNVDIAKTASAPAGCTIDPLGQPEQVLLENSTTVSHQEWFVIHCDEASTHGPFTIDNVISIKDPGITDPDTTNNDASSSIDVNAWAYADIQIVGQQILAANCLDPAPTEIALSEDVTICVHKLLHNDGPYAAQPVHVDVTKTTWASAGATILPPTHTEQVELYFSDVVPHVEYFTIHCYEPSTHEFRVDNDVTVKDEHVIDPDGGASASGSIFVDCLASTDIKITSQSFLDPPVQMTVGVPEVVTLRKQLHNNGGYGPAMVDIDKTAYTNSPDATIAPPSDSAQVDLPVSSTVIHDEDFTLGCSAPGIYTYTVENDVTSKEPHISGGDFESTDLIVECVEGAPQEIKWDQLPDESPDGLDVGTLEPGFPLVLADDFLCTESGLITQIDFWASWHWDDPPFGDPALVQFTLSLHSDVPAGVDLPWSHPGELLWEYWFDAGQCIVEPWAFGVEEGWLDPPIGFYDPFADTQIWLYICPIPEPYWFQQEEDTVYWLDIQPVPVEPTFFWGWKTSIDHWNDASVWAVGPEPVDPLDWNDLWYPPQHWLYGNPIDLAFRLWGHECDPLLDSDGDTFTDDIECYLPTDRLDDCTDNPGVHDAWPLDNDMTRDISVTGDVFNYVGRVGAIPGAPNWWKRLDIDMSSDISVTGDVFQYVGKVGQTCI